MMVYSTAFWEDVRLAYEHGDEPVVALAKRFGIAKSTLLKRVRKDGWLPRAKRKVFIEQSREAMIRRLYRSINLKLAQLEMRMQNENDLTVADHERETRAIGQLIRNFEKVTVLESGEQNGTNAKRSCKPEYKPDSEQLDPHCIRKELAERILRLREKQGCDN